MRVLNCTRFLIVINGDLLKEMSKFFSKIIDMKIQKYIIWPNIKMFSKCLGMNIAAKLEI